MLKELLAILLIVAGYKVAMMIAARKPIFQPLIVSVVLVWVSWWLLSNDWEAFSAGGAWISYWLGPATVALAVPLAKQIKEFAHIWRGLFLGIAAGCGVSILSVLLIHACFGFDNSVMYSMLSKSVTTPIALELAHSVGGIPALAALFTALTGFIGTMFAQPLLAWAGVTDDRAIGVAVGTSTHAIGTASLNRISQAQMAASSVAMIVAGVMTSLYLIPFSL
ncbi:LrgB family protein [Brevibacillus panacihumi]|uniref:LrgB family protein n=1 Tax=Brevibacillus panacihumi TaxID=497735 RepID=A0A3M8DEB8_9BACL|nr:LrgB family protein [Brevibacillus panacihumi]RNB86343.1 LrgB family protein [Brevibacillus panacihumi]